MARYTHDRQAAATSPPGAVLGVHRVFGRTPLDALSTFCDRHRWHARFAPPPNAETLATMICPIEHPGEWYPVRVTPLAVAAVAVGGAQDRYRYLSHPGDYRIVVLPW
jgi:hypothetical protein